MDARRIVVTGASRGIGLEMTRQLTAAGHHVYATARNPASADALHEIAPTAILPLDIADESSIAAFGAALAADTPAIDILVNNAGTTTVALGAANDARGPWDVDPAHILEATRINALGPMMVTRTLLGLLEAGKNPVVLNTSSQLGSMVVGAMMAFDLAYNVSKAALNMVTVTSAATNKNVCFVALHPGWVKTDMGSQAAQLEVPEAAGAIINTLLSLTIADSGSFVRWDGVAHPW